MVSRPDPLLRLEGVAFGYGGKDVLHDINLTLNEGEFRFLTGPVGAGKTSLLHVLSLSHPVTGGTMTLMGREITRLGREEKANLRQKVGVVFQDFRLIEHLSAFDNVALPLRIKGTDDERIGRFVPEILEWLGLGAVMDSVPKRLSIGQRQLVAVARAVIARPPLLLADEPTSNIDPGRAEQVMRLLLQLRQLGTAVVVATHGQDLLRRYPGPVWRIAAGRIAVEGTPPAQDPPDPPSPPKPREPRE